MTTTEAANDVVVPTVRLAVEDLTPGISEAMYVFQRAAAKVSVERPVLELVKLRASQLNGCAYCVDMHSADALKIGESQRKVLALPVWREAPFFTARERAALELTEAATDLAGHPFDDAVLDRAAGHFTEVELAELLWTIAVINVWNRLGAVARPWPLSNVPDAS
jgi:AhpD family alkylhydroperoxidase